LISKESILTNRLGKIIQHLGEAVDIIPTLDMKFDFGFIDADKENYINYF
jgi:predicted O-methyltransferase YrrM